MKITPDAPKNVSGLTQMIIMGKSIRQIWVKCSLMFITYYLLHLKSLEHVDQINEPPRGKTNNVVSEQARHKPTCTVTEAG